ncbi:hypothetical protein BJ138DRAFT_1114951 [Hygrophoropsis aurantiaca]|uniref:Uncharacterized protein n=1 Tax=Hygrophoropsis aurantiaca TaxID=72124 RepID=A0ACB8A7N1_9AGAM|nr:hypothetical protein BJ138DRAFT_1114951 [Hygrophoropsis aurantiaca]
MPLSTKTAIVTLLALGVSVIAVKPWPKWDDKSFVLKVSGLASGEENPGYNYCGKENDCSYPRQVPKNAKCTHCSNFGHDMNDHMQYFEFITGKSIMGGDKDLMVEFYKDAGLLGQQYTEHPSDALQSGVPATAQVEGNKLFPGVRRRVTQILVPGVGAGK